MKTRYFYSDLESERIDLVGESRGILLVVGEKGVYPPSCVTVVLQQPTMFHPRGLIVEIKKN